jgi:hypothetical protein
MTKLHRELCRKLLRSVCGDALRLETPHVAGTGVKGIPPLRVTYIMGCASR